MNEDYKEEIKKLQLQILRIQQGIYHSKSRLILVFEGVDAAGKGGVIRRITENLDPRGVHVYPIGVPNPEDQGKHYLYRFWMRLPAPGMISIFDRSWYGRVLVERVNKLIPKAAWNRAYSEINQFEKMLTDDGVHLLKFCLKISKAEQKKRFEERLNDPYKQWKITKEDLQNRAKWNEYAKAQEEMFQKTNRKDSPWYVIETDNKEEARLQVLSLISEKLQDLKMKKK